MPLLRPALIFVGGGVCGAGLACALLSQGATGRLGKASPPPPTEVAVERPRPSDSEARTVFAVTNDEQAHIQSQMLEFLVDLQNLNTALAEADRDWIRDIATVQATRRDPTGMGQQLRKKAPEGFSQISQSLRRDFTDLGEAAGSEPIEELQQRLSLLMAKCVACHGSYAVSAPPTD